MGLIGPRCYICGDHDGYTFGWEDGPCCRCEAMWAWRNACIPLVVLIAVTHVR